MFSPVLYSGLFSGLPLKQLLKENSCCPFPTGVPRPHLLPTCEAPQPLCEATPLNHTLDIEGGPWVVICIQGSSAEKWAWVVSCRGAGVTSMRLWMKQEAKCEPEIHEV